MLTPKCQAISLSHSSSTWRGTIYSDSTSAATSLPNSLMVSAMNSSWWSDNHTITYGSTAPYSAVSVQECICWVMRETGPLRSENLRGFLWLLVLARCIWQEYDSESVTAHPSANKRMMHWKQDGWEEWDPPHVLVHRFSQCRPEIELVPMYIWYIRVAYQKKVSSSQCQFQQET